jgi:hypothetical protein
MIRLFVLLTWHPAAGLPVDPVGVLGIEQDGGSCKHHVRWLAASGRTNAGWRARLSEPPTPETIQTWLNQDGVNQLVEIATPPAARGLGQAVEIAAEVIRHLGMAT